MLNSIKPYIRFKNQFKIEMLLNGCVVTIVLVILFTAVLALLRPVSTEHYQKIVELSEQDVQPHVKEMALRYRHSENIYTADYFQLMRAYQNEMLHVKEYAAVKGDGKY